MAKLALFGGSPVRTKPFPGWPQVGPEEEEGLLRVLRSGKWFEHQGEEATRFSEEFAAYHDARFGINTNAGTTALWLALYASGVRPGHEVIVPSYTFVASATSILMAGAVPIFADVEADTFNIDPAAIEPLITPRTKAIMAVHFGGYPADLDAIEKIAKKHGLLVIEDAAHAHGSVFRGKKLGAQGTAGGFSFQASKNITAGEGGIVLTNSEEILDEAYSVKMYGRPRQGKVWYDHARFGGNFRMTEFQAAILRAQLLRLEEQTETRLHNARIIEEGMKELPGFHPQFRGDSRVTRRSYHLFLFRYVREELDGIPRERVLEALCAEGVPTWIGYSMSLQRQPLFTDRKQLTADCPEAALYDGLTPDYARVETPVSDRLCTREACWMGQSMLLGDEQNAKDILDAMTKIVENRKELLAAS